MNRLPILLLSAALSASAAEPATKPAAKVSTDWVGTDRYDRPMAEFAEAGPKRPDKVVGMFYYLWHGQHTPPWGNDVTKYLQEHDGDMSGMSPFPKPNELSKDPWTYYWAEPEDGYYNSKDPWILKKHLRLLSHAGVDFLYFDCTNGWTYLDVVEELCKASMELRAQGLKTPQIAMVVSTGATEAIQTMYDEFYSKGEYEELWFKWEGKPLILGHRDKAPSEEIADFFTWRKSDAWSGVNEDRWDWINPTGHGWKGTPDTIEQMSVSKGSHATLNVGSSYVITDFNGPHAAGTGYQPPVDKFWLCEDTGKGDYWEAQWDRTLQLDPQVVMITQWNEWVAGCFEWAPGVQASSSFLGKPLELGDRFFVDEFNAEFNRDIEPMKGGYGDAFVYRMLHWIRKFKGMDAPVEVSGPATIPIDGEFSEWKSVQPAYTDFEGDTEHRDFMAYDATHLYTNTTGRNDIVEMKVAADQKNLFFHVKTDKPLTPPTDPNWMLLFLDTDKDKTTGWEGYDFVVNAEVKDGKTTTLKKWVDGDWRTVESLSYAMKDNQLELAIPLTSLGMKPDAVDFHFKWADNMPDLKDAAGFNSDGDAAPDRGFNFHYTNIPGNPPAGGRQDSAVTSPVAAEDLSLANPSFEEECSADSKIGNWLLVTGAGGSAWGRFGGATGGVVASDGGTLLFTNRTAAVVVQLLKEAPIRAGKYVFSMDVNSPVSGSGADLVSARGVQMAVYAIPTASDNEARFTLIAEKSISAAAMGRDEQWKPLEVAFNIPASSPLIGQFFQINIASSAPAPGAPEPAQVNIDNVRAKRLSSSAGPRAATMPAGGRLESKGPQIAWDNVRLEEAESVGSVPTPAAQKSKPVVKVITDWVGIDSYRGKMANLAEAGPKRPVRSWACSIISGTASTPRRGGTM